MEVDVAKFHPRYCFEDGDIVLASRKGTKFKVHSVLLKLSSSVLRDMLEIPRVLEESNSDPVQLDEEDFILEFLLDSIYPTDSEPSFRYGLSEIEIKAGILTVRAQAIARSCDKYDMPRALQILCISVENDPFFKSEPLHRFVIAPFLKSREFENRAVYDCKKVDILTIGDKQGESSIFLRMDANQICELLKNYTSTWEKIEGVFHDVELDEYYADNAMEDVFWACECGEVGVQASRLNFILQALAAYARGYLAFHPSGTEFRLASFWECLGELFEEISCEDCYQEYLSPDSLSQRLREIVTE